MTVWKEIHFQYTLNLNDLRTSKKVKKRCSACLIDGFFEIFNKMGARPGPRRGSMGVWPRKRANKPRPRVRGWAVLKDSMLSAFPGYKVGMAQALVQDNGVNSMTKGQNIVIPTTIIECPPINVFGVVFYKHTSYGPKTIITALSPQLDKKTLSRAITIPKNHKKIEDVKEESFDDLRLLIHTNPRKTSVGKKKPEVFEMSVGGDKKAKLEYAKQVLGKEVNVNEILSVGSLIDAHSITKGKGYQGPVKRFGVAIRHHKSEKTKRGPGSLGPWHGPKMWRVSHAGQMGYHQRIDYNKRILSFETDPAKVNPSGGFVRYGFVKSNYLVIKGSLPGPKKRMILLRKASRPSKIKEQLIIKQISLKSQQG